MSNPSVRAHLKFLPEDSGNHLSQANQADRWLKELDPDLLTPVQHLAGQDFFTLEPAILTRKRVCMPSRWFIRDKNLFAKAWTMRIIDDELFGSGWAVQTFNEIEIPAADFVVAFNQFQTTHITLGLPDPCAIVGMSYV